MIGSSGQVTACPGFSSSLVDSFHVSDGHQDWAVAGRDYCVTAS